MKSIRQPIVTFAGHVDHGKTSIQDYIRGTSIAEKEAGAITQKISSTLLPAKTIKEKCSDLLKKFNLKLEVPGFLFIDTPGHAAFTNLRKRGGALADLAVLVIDINEGIKPQTRESIEILRNSKIPFVIVLNKIDNIRGWQSKSKKFMENYEKQADFAKKQFDEKFYNLMGIFSEIKFEIDFFFKIKDFTKKIAVVPCSAKTGEGISELIAMLVGLSQKFLKNKLKLSKKARGTILEVKKEKILSIEAVLYDGEIKKGDVIVIASLEEPITTKIRALFNAKPLGKGYKPAEKVKAASTLLLHLPSGEVYPGMPFIVCKTKEEIEQAKKELQKEIQEEIKTNKEGIVIKADSLGSLEALLFILHRNNVKIERAGIGNITKQDVVAALSISQKNPVNGVVLGFNVKPELDINEIKEKNKIKILTNEVIYKLTEDLQEFQKEKQKEIEREKLSELTLPFKIKLLKNCMFRQSKPAICGITVLAGTLKPKKQVMNEKGQIIDKIKTVQSENKSVEKAEKGKDVAISLPKITLGRQLKEEEVLYSNITEPEFRELKKNKVLLTSDEIKILQEIAEIKRKEKTTWGI